MNHKELKESIKNDPNLTGQEKAQKLKELREPYRHMTDEELLSLCEISPKKTEGNPCVQMCCTTENLKHDSDHGRGC